MSLESCAETSHMCLFWRVQHAEQLLQGDYVPQSTRLTTAEKLILVLTLMPYEADACISAVSSTV